MFVIFSENAEVGTPPAYLILLITLGLSKHVLQDKSVSTRRNLLIAQKETMWGSEGYQHKLSWTKTGLSGGITHH